jgi:hypothetical protein
MVVEVNNTTGADVTINTVEIKYNDNLTIRDDTMNNTQMKGYMEDFLLLDGQSTFNEYVKNGNFVIIKDSVDQTVNEAFELLTELRWLYNAAIEQAALVAHSTAEFLG